MYVVKPQHYSIIITCILINVHCELRACRSVCHYGQCSFIWFILLYCPPTFAFDRILYTIHVLAAVRAYEPTRLYELLHENSHSHIWDEVLCNMYYIPCSSIKISIKFGPVPDKKKRERGVQAVNEDYFSLGTSLCSLVYYSGIGNCYTFIAPLFSLKE